MDQFLGHYGVKGMTWGSTRDRSLDRIFRVEAGTTSRKDRINKARKAKMKDIVEDPKKTNDKNGETVAKSLLEKVGVVRLTDIGQ